MSVGGQTVSARLGDITEIVMGQAPPGADCNRQGRGTPFVKAGEFKGYRPVIREWTTNPLKVARSGDVLVCVVGATAGKINESIDCAIGRSVAAVRPDPSSLSSKYLYHFLGTQVLRLRAKSQGLAQGVITREMLQEISVPIPPLAEQRRIAEILDKADELRAKRRAALAKLDTLTQSIFLDMFGDPATNPKGWPTITLKQALTIPLRNGLSPSKIGKVSAQVLTLSAITGSAFDDAARKVSTFLSSPPADQSVASKDFLICRGNGNIQLVGRGQFPIRSMPEVTFPDTMIAARVSAQLIEPSFLQHVWNSIAVRQQIESLARTTNGTFKVNQTMLEGITFISPPVPFQCQFTYRATVIEETKKKECESVARLDALFAVLQHRAFRGEL